MFTPIQFESGKMMNVKLAVSQTIVKYEGLEWASGYLQACTTASADVRFVAMEAVTTDGSSHTECLVLPVEGVRFECDCDDVASIADLGTYCQPATSTTLDPDDSTADCFYIDEIVGEEEVSKVVRGHFIHALE